MRDETPRAPARPMVTFQATLGGEGPANKIVSYRRFEVEGKAKEHKAAETLGGQIFSTDGIKKVAAWYIDTSEKVANGVLDYQATATEWAKSTALAPIFEAQHDLAERYEIKRFGGVVVKH